MLPCDPCSELCLRMMIFSSSKVLFVLVVSFRVVEGTLTPGGTVSVDCGSTRTFICDAPDVSIGWNIAGLSGINIPGPFLVRNAAIGNSRISTNDTGGNKQNHVSLITISGFSLTDNGGTIQCVNMNNNNNKGRATISVAPLPLPPPTNVAATTRSCDTVTLQWDQPSGLNDITTSVSCTPPSPGCVKCAVSPCNITGLKPSTDYVFTVTLSSGECKKNMSYDTATTGSCTSTEMPGTNSNTAPSSAPLAALVLLLLPIPLIYALGVLIAQLLFFKDKTYCELFWCCFCCRKDKSESSYELRQPREEAAYQNVPKKKQVVTNGDKIKEPKRSKQEVVTDEAFRKQGAKDGDAITDETVQQQGTPDGHHKQRRSHQREEEVQYQNLGVAKKQESVTNGDEVKKPKRSKQEVINTGIVMQQQGNPDGIEYADLDFSEHDTGRNVIHAIEDPVTYADV